MVEQLDISPNQDGAILKEVKRTGEDPNDKPWKGDRVSVHYVGTLEDGTQFDSSRNRNEQFVFNLGKQEVIKGWDFGVITMAKGEVATFTIKAEYAYGSTGSPPKIPGGATLIFEIELFDFEGEDISKERDKSLVKRIQSSGEGYDHPNDGGNVSVEIKGYSSKGVFEERELDFLLGEGREFGIPRGVELAIEKMKKKEIAQVMVIPRLCQGGNGVASNNTETLKYQISLKSFERAKESWQMDGEQKLEQSVIFKDKGTEFFKQKKYELAANKYNKVIEFLEHEISLKDQKEEERVLILQAGRLNLAMCMIKMNNWIDARNLCDKVIEEKPGNAKAYFRRGEAFIALNEHELARLDFQKVLELDPENKAAKNKVTICAHEIKSIKEKEKKTFANMFEKFAQIDARKAEEALRREKPVEINDWEDGKPSPFIAEDKNRRKLQEEPEDDDDFDEEEDEELDSPKALSGEP